MKKRKKKLEFLRFLFVNIYGSIDLHGGVQVDCFSGFIIMLEIYWLPGHGILDTTIFLC